MAKILNIKNTQNTTLILPFPFVQFCTKHRVKLYSLKKIAKKDKVMLYTKEGHIGKLKLTRSSLKFVFYQNEIIFLICQVERNLMNLGTTLKVL